jgi:hypothetical protein
MQGDKAFSIRGNRAWTSCTLQYCDGGLGSELALPGGATLSELAVVVRVVPELALVSVLLEFAMVGIAMAVTTTTIAWFVVVAIRSVGAGSGGCGSSRRYPPHAHVGASAVAVSASASGVAS